MKIDNMTAKQKIEAVKRWQSNSNFHPATCGCNSEHRPLVAENIGNVMPILTCRDCSYIQRIPWVIYAAWLFLRKENNES
jgi:hypothetical protein